MKRVGSWFVVLLTSCALSRTVNYAGSLNPESGLCDPPTRATLTLRQDKIIFAPAEGTLQLQGEITGNALTAELNLLDANKRPYWLMFQGVRTGSVIEGVYKTPRCTYATKLRVTGDY
jgi:hypothetical protein